MLFTGMLVIGLVACGNKNNADSTSSDAVSSAEALTSDMAPSAAAETSDVTSSTEAKTADTSSSSETQTADAASSAAKSEISGTEVTQSGENKDFFISEISDELFEKMQGKSYKEDCTVPREDLRYLHVLHVGFDGETHEGELVCNKFIAEDLLEIFQELYKSGYQIEKIRLIDEYDADDETAMRDNDSSCFNFRFISHTKRVSKHGAGLAVDINTLYNPYIKEVDGETILEPATAGEYVDHSRDFPHKINENDLAYQLFTEHGFEWGGSWTDRKDYQHFEIPNDVIEENNLNYGA
ncbi:MAG: M15 family metallopeptidase [Lachnospiraceae bacterium]|jgi:hypothetical protein|nr:M15 family metallopeptidase [Lachnospiraceae bacterium]